MNPFWYLVAFIIGVVAVARATRLLIYDDFPPTRALRVRYLSRASDDWAPLAACQFCLAPYLAAANLTWAWLSGVDWDTLAGGSWWVVNLWAAGSYLAAIVVSYDQPED